MKITTEQIKQMIVEELRSLMEQEKSYDELLDELAAEIKQYNSAFLRNSPLFGDIWKILMEKHVRSAVPNMMSYVIEKVIGVWGAFAKKPGDPEWNAEEAVGEVGRRGCRTGRRLSCGAHCQLCRFLALSGFRAWQREHL